MKHIRSADEWPLQMRPHSIAFVRHGEKAGSGFSADLTEKGYQDAVSAGSRIRFPVDLFLTSPSPRAVSTAKGIRSGNGSSADIIEMSQLAEPGLGMYMEFVPAMRSFFSEILEVIGERGAETIVAATHNYVVEYVAEAMGCPRSEPGYLSGLVVNLEDLSQVCERL